MFGEASLDLNIMRWTCTLSLANGSAKMRGVHEEGIRDQGQMVIPFPRFPGRARPVDAVLRRDISLVRPGSPSREV
jgi:hypothetical protein